MTRRSNRLAAKQAKGPKGQDAPRGRNDNRAAPPAAAAAANNGEKNGRPAKKMKLDPSSKEYAEEKAAFYNDRAAENDLLMHKYEKYFKDDCDKALYWEKEATKRPAMADSVARVAAQKEARKAELEAEAAETMQR